MLGAPGVTELFRGKKGLALQLSQRKEGRHSQSSGDPPETFSQLQTLREWPGKRDT